MRDITRLLISAVITLLLLCCASPKNYDVQVNSSRGEVWVTMHSPTMGIATLGQVNFDGFTLEKVEEDIFDGIRHNFFYDGNYDVYVVLQSKNGYGNYSNVDTVKVSTLNGAEVKKYASYKYFIGKANLSAAFPWNRMETQAESCVTDSCATDSAAAIFQDNESLDMIFSGVDENESSYQGTDIGVMIGEYLSRIGNGQYNVDFGLFNSNASLYQTDYDTGEYDDLGPFGVEYIGIYSIGGMRLRNTPSRKCRMMLLGPHAGADIMVVEVGSYNDNYEDRIIKSLADAVSGVKLKSEGGYQTKYEMFKAGNGYLLVEIVYGGSAAYMTIYVSGDKSIIDECMKRNYIDS